MYLSTISLINTAQINIGSETPPALGSILDLNNEQGTINKGLGLPRVALSTLTGDLAKSLNPSTPEGSLDKDKHTGLIVYNITKNETSTNRICPGLHVWNGEEWKPTIPYPEVQTEKKSTYVSTSLRFLQPGLYQDLTQSAIDELWQYFGKRPEDFPIGETGTFTDTRGDETNTYYYTRYYVGYVAKKYNVETKSNYSCDPNTPKWTTPTTESVTQYFFDDGVWMNESLRTTKTPSGENLDLFVPGDATKYSTTRGQYAYPNNNATNRVHGLLYNWRAAVNIPIEEILEKNTNEEGQYQNPNDKQGICPNGWHLPSDREWTDLENGIILKTNLFSTSSVIGGSSSLLNYYTMHTWRGLRHGQAMKSKDKLTVSAKDPYGTSKTSTEGGFT